MKAKKWTALGLWLCILFSMLYILYIFNYIPHAAYTNETFHIQTYHSHIDKDDDGIDDQSDILQNTRAYIATKPAYKSKYYAGGYPDDAYGVCTDVVGYALKHAGYDLMFLVHEDIKNNREAYDIDVIDKNIDFRRVKNIKTYFDRHALVLTTDITKIEEWQGGDIVVFKNHIGMVSDKRNRKGIPFIIHHAHAHQASYEEDILELRRDVIAHYRIS